MWVRAVLFPSCPLSPLCPGWGCPVTLSGALPRVVPISVIFSVPSMYKEVEMVVVWEGVKAATCCFVVWALQEEDTVQGWGDPYSWPALSCSTVLFPTHAQPGCCPLGKSGDTHSGCCGSRVAS